MMMYRIQDGGKGQWYAGYFTADPTPKTEQPWRLIKRHQARTKDILEGHMANGLGRLCDKTSNVKTGNTWLVQFILGPEHGRIEFFPDAEQAYDAIVAANPPGGAWMYGPKKAREYFGHEQRERVLRPLA
jgi:hypothetical protein